MNTQFETSDDNYKDEWLTPPDLLKKLGEFDLDPYSPINRPWDTAKKHYTLNDNGLMQNWEGRVFLNPPYGREMIHWLNKMGMHKNGITMIYARTETGAFHEYIFPVAHAILFIKGRISFYRVDGTLGGGIGCSLSSYQLLRKGNRSVTHLRHQRKTCNH